jgi:site-specific recombinase XerD
MPKLKKGKHRRTFTFQGKLLGDRTFTSKKEADAWYENLRRKAERVKAGLPLAMDDIPVRNAFAKWIALREKTSDYWMQDNTKAQAMVPRFGDKTVQAVTKGDCEGVLHGIRLEHELSGATFNRYRACLHTFFEFCIDEGYRETNPVGRIERMAEQKRGAHVPAEKVKTYLQALREEEAVYFAFMVLAMNCGARPGELVALTWADYQPSLRRIEIRRRFQRDLGRMKDGTKGGSGRLVPLNDFAIAAIEGYRPSARLTGPEDLIFQRADGSLMSLDQLRFVHERATKAAGLPDTVRPYDITRHKFASEVTRKLGIRAAQELLGHSTSAITERYAHADPESLINRVVDAVTVGAEGENEVSGKEEAIGKKVGDTKDFSQSGSALTKKGEAGK